MVILFGMYVNEKFFVCRAAVRITDGHTKPRDEKRIQWIAK